MGELRPLPVQVGPGASAAPLRVDGSVDRAQEMARRYIAGYYHTGGNRQEGPGPRLRVAVPDRAGSDRRPSIGPAEGIRRGPSPVPVPP